MRSGMCPADRAVAKAERDHRLAIAVGEPLGMDVTPITGLDAQIPTGAPVVLAWACGRTTQAQFAAQSLAASWAAATGREVTLAVRSDDGEAIASAVQHLQECAWASARTSRPACLSIRKKC